jgi:FkbM family methyltransferase
MYVIPQAFWSESGNTLTFHLPRPQEQLPKGADGVSGSILDSHSYVGDESISVKTVSLAEILKREQRTQCDVLKMDIEGAEYEVLEALCNSGDISLAKQLLVEFHHGVTTYCMADTERLVSILGDKKFKLIHTEGRNYIFRQG